MKEYDVRIADHGDGTFSIVSAFSRTNETGLIPIAKTVVARILHRHYKNELVKE